MYVMNALIKSTLIIFSSLFFVSIAHTQERWTDIDETNILKNQSDLRFTFPEKFRLMSLDMRSMKTQLLEIAAEKSNSNLVEIPLPNGQNQTFEVTSSSIFDTKLASKYPDIQSFTGYAIDNSGARVKISIGFDGFHAFILTPGKNPVYVDPYFFKSEKYYMSYFKKDTNKEGQEFECHFDEKQTGIEEDEFNFKAGDCNFRTYELALACTGEYAQFHGGTIPDVISAFNTTMTRVNGIYESEASITMILVPNNEDLIYLNGTTDPYSNGNPSAMLNQNQNTCDNIIGSANYDIGHVFGTGGGGVAVLNGPCNSNNKAKGVTGLNSPVGDVFDVDYVCHEIGHQFGALHTFNNSCNGNRSDNSAYEPGSGSTIMAYAGICAPNVQNVSDAYFHARSLFQMGSFSSNGGNGCADVTTPTNSAPTVNAGPNRNIPRGTSFFLTATASDPNSSDVLSYCWEQYDNEIGSMPPSPTNTVGPMFRTLNPSLSNTRYFPAMESILAGINPTWEVIPTVGRNLDFRVTVRDNAPTGGCTDESNMNIIVNGTIGPFTVSSHGSAELWMPGESEEITWNVAGTTNAPVSCSQVDILLSVDGGYNYDIILAEATANDGAHTITVPTNFTYSDCRYMVVCSDNIFFDINNATIGVGTPPLSDYCQASYNNASCESGDYIQDVSFNEISNINNGCALSGNYSNFTGQSSDAEVGTSYDLTVKSGPNFAMYAVAVIDFNQDGDFLDAGEFTQIGFVPISTEVTKSISIPATATEGATLMRIITQRGNNPITQSGLCGNFDFGEVEDYTLRIKVFNCPLDLTIIDDYGDGDVLDFEATNTIIANNYLSRGANIQYDAGQCILLDIGFEVESRANFHAFIDGCGNLIMTDRDQ